MKNRIKAFILAALTAATAMTSMTACGGKEQSSTKTFDEVRAEADIDWETIIGNIEKADLSGTGWYINADTARNDAEEDGCITFCNYESDFMSVKQQITICYGIIMKDTVDSVEYYDEPLLEIQVIDNSSDKFYYGVYSVQGKTVSEGGEWFLTDDKQTAISQWTDFCVKTMGV